MNTFLNADLRMVKADQRVELLKPGQPLYFQYWNDQVEVFEEPTIFLHETFVKAGGTPSKHTWEAVGYDLLSWFQWCQAKGEGVEWRDATESDREKFADDYEAAATDEKMINRKLTTVRRFYDFARTEGWYHRDIGALIENNAVFNRAIDDDFLAHTRSSAGRMTEKDPLLKKVGRKDVIKPLQVKNLRKLLEHAGPTTQDEVDKRSVRNRLICDLGYISGARLGDVTTLTTLQFLSITVEPHQQLADFPLIVEGKKKVTRKVATPGWLILAVQAYIARERGASEREGKKRGVKSTTSLFLGHPGSKSAGKPITRSAIQKMFALACMQCGITQQDEVVDVGADRKLNHF